MRAGDRLLAASDFRGTLAVMKTRIDSAGRAVVPKALRQALGLRAGQTLEIRARDGRLEIEAAATPMELRKRGNGPVAVPKTGKMPTLTSEQVRDTLERVRR
jgi:AbrB family looped-hinge helix DNA binding protein